MTTRKIQIEYVYSSKDTCDSLKIWYDNLISTYTIESVPPAPEGHGVSVVSANGSNWQCVSDTWVLSREDGFAIRDAIIAIMSDEAYLNPISGLTTYREDE
jgi:hypothetical protein